MKNIEIVIKLEELKSKKGISSKHKKALEEAIEKLSNTGSYDKKVIETLLTLLKIGSNFF